MHEEEVPEPRECANCGAIDDLLVCSRCHTAWFCGPKCQKAYWPFHKTECKRNEFADLMEAQEPKFARWMRRHGKMAQLKDDEVDRLERAAAATAGPGRQEVMESMYGRLQPKPQEPSYSAEEVIRMRRAEEAGKAKARAALTQGWQQQYEAIKVPEGLGLDCQRYKWRQNQSHVEVFIPLPPGLPASKVSVELTPTSLAVQVDEQPLLGGTLYREIKRDESTWYIQDGVLELVLLKRHRRGNYEQGKTNADSFWWAVLRSAPAQDALALLHPPTHYYYTHCDDLPKQPPLRLANRQQELPAAQGGKGLEAGAKAEENCTLPGGALMAA